MEGLKEAVEALKRSILVYGLTDEQVASVAALAKRESFTAGEHLALLGANESDLFVLVSGHVNILTHDSDKLGEVSAGGVLGEVSFVDAGPRHAHYVASGFTTVLRFPARELRAFMSRDRNIGFLMLANLARMLSARLRNADGRLDALMDLEHDVWHHAL